jgi:hypothetical protein
MTRRAGLVEDLVESLDASCIGAALQQTASLFHSSRPGIGFDRTPWSPRVVLPCPPVQHPHKKRLRPDDKLLH